MKEFIEIPFGAKDSELCGWEYTIPKGFVASIENGKIVVKKEDGEDERIRKALIAFFRDGAKRNYSTFGVDDKDILAWLEKQGKCNFEQSIQEGDKIVTNEDGTHFNVSQLERVAKKVTKSKENAKEFLKSTKIMDGNGELADEYRLEKQDEQKPNPYTGTSFEYNGHTWGMCARDNGVEILFDGELKAFLSSDKSFIYPIHPQPDLVPKNAMEVIKEEKVDNANKVEPKFKVGDYLVNDYCKGKVIALTDDAYLLDTEQGIPFSCEHNAHLWTIQDAKDGDVLVDRFSKDNIIILYKGINPKLSVLAYCGWNGYNLSIKTNGLGYGGLDNTNYLPATKEQQDLLFQKMKEEGYEWDAENKELKNIEQKSTWSEEDEWHLKIVISRIKEFGDSSVFGLINNDIQWLKSLKERIYPRPKQEWSEEDEGMLEDIRFNYEFNKSGMTEGLIEQYNKWFEKIKSLKPQLQWKPSEEQIKDFGGALLILKLQHYASSESLESLYEQLKKL